MTTAQERKQQERHARRRRIQRAARTVFAEKGYAKTSIEQIAREASLSVGAIYLYFRSKEDLYVSLLEETLETFDNDLAAVAHRGDAADIRLREAWDYLTGWAKAEVEATRVLRLASQPGVRKQLSDEVAECVGKGLTKMREHLGHIVKDGISQGVYTDMEPDAAVDLAWTLHLGMLQAADARSNLGLPGGDFEALSQTAFTAVENSLRTKPTAQA
jgi:AcrR family transcriptional regulator